MPRFEDLPLRNPRDIALQRATREIRRTLLGMPFQYSDFVAAFLSCGSEPTETSASILRVFTKMATERGLSPGERVMIIGDLVHQIGWDIIADEARREQG